MNDPGQSIVATVMEPDTRWQLDAAVGGRCQALHAHTLGEAIRAVRERPVDAVLVSPSAVHRCQLPELTRLINGFPGVPTLAVVAAHDRQSSERLLALGAHGVSELIDLTDRTGWTRLRSLIGQPTNRTAARILGVLVPELGEPTRESRHFFEMLVRLAPGIKSARQLARFNGIPPSTFVSRFQRVNLPSPKRYLAALRLVFAAGLLGAPGRSIADVAYRLEFSSPQSFGRHLQTALGMTAGEFRQRFPFEVAIDDYLKTYVRPFRAVFRTFQPFQLG